MTTAAMKNDVRGGCASEKSTLRYLAANGMPSWDLQFRLLGFKGAVQLQIAMENGPFACRVFVAICSYAAPETRGAAQPPPKEVPACWQSHRAPAMTIGS